LDASRVGDALPTAMKNAAAAPLDARRQRKGGDIIRVYIYVICCFFFGFFMYIKNKNRYAEMIQ